MADPADEGMIASRLAAIVESSSDAIIGKDLDGIVTSWNHGAEVIFGYTAAEMIGSSILRLIPADRLTEEGRILEQIRRGEGVKHFETRRLHKDGRAIDVSVTTSPIRNAAGEIVGASKVARDITERKQAEAAQRLTEGRYRTLFDYAPDGILIADRQSRYLDANASICRMLGYAHHELVGLHASDIVVEAEVPHIETALREIASRDDYYREWRFRRKDGSVFSAEVIATTMPDGKLLGMVRDVTERKQAVDALRAAEERMRFALESAGVGIWDLDYTTGVLRWSNIVEQQYGVPDDTFGGTFDAYIACVHPDDRAAVIESAAAARTGSDFTTVHRALWPDGTVRWLSGAGRTRLGPNGEPVRGVGISLDITERRALEEQFQQAQKMEALGRLAGGVAHDFNNLLTAILGYCELLLVDFGPGDAHQADISEIQKAGTRAAGLTRQLLAFSRKQIIEPARIDLNTLVAEMTPLLGRLIGEDVTIVTQLHPGLAAVVADRGQLEQVVMNLAVNARDAMPRGGTLTIETANVELDEHYVSRHRAVAPGSYVVLRVTDTGTGMTPEVRARLFEPFFTTKEAGKGTGLGLATVDGIVARSGGSIGVYSELDRGTSFSVYLPQADLAAVAAAAPPPRPQPHAFQATPKTVLVVDDAESLRELTSRLLRRRGYKVLTAANADDARQRCDTEPIDVVLTDVVMPGASGPELAAGLVAKQPALGIVYMSGYTEDAIVHHGVLKPGVFFLHKPFTSDALAAKIEEALQGVRRAPG